MSRVAGPCPECGADRAGLEWSFEHVCATAALPEPLAARGAFAIRETPGGRQLWKSYVDATGETDHPAGTQVAYPVGAVWGADDEALDAAIDAAEEEMAALMADASVEFGTL